MSYTEFGQLKEVIVGNEFEINKRVFDFTFKNMYKDNLTIFGNYCHDIDNYSISTELIQERLEDLNNFTIKLEELGVKTYRPEVLKKIQQIKTNTFDSITSPSNNVRDIVLTYGKKIIETPILVRNRYFENNLLHPIFKEKLNEGYQWIKAPYGELNERTLDLNNWTEDRDFEELEKNGLYTSRYEMGIDAANCIKIGKDIICNVSTYNHYLGYKWLQNILPEANIHIIKLADSHIDGTLMPLRPGTFLVNNFEYTKNYLKDRLPKKFKKWDIIIPGKTTNYFNEDDMYDKFNKNLNFHLASSRGMDINVLSLNEKQVFVLDRAHKTIDILEKNNFEPIPIKLRHGEIFAGGLHCSTLDLRRDDKRIDYN